MQAKRLHIASSFKHTINVCRRLFFYRQDRVIQCLRTPHTTSIIYELNVAVTELEKLQHLDVL